MSMVRGETDPAKLSEKREVLTPWQQFAYFLEKVQGIVRLQDLLFFMSARRRKKYSFRSRGNP